MTLKKKITISIAFSLVFCILLIVFAIYPLFSEIKKNSQDFLSQKQKLMALEEKIENLEKFKIILPEISAGLEKIDNLFVDPKVPIDFIRFLEKTSQDSELSLKISPGPSLKIEKDPWPSIVFQLSLTGSFPNLCQFLEKLESGLYLMEIQNLTISRLVELEEDKSSSRPFAVAREGDVEATLSIKVYTK